MDFCHCASFLFSSSPTALSTVLTHFCWFLFWPQMIFSSAFMSHASHLLCSCRSFPPVPLPPFSFQLFLSHTHLNVGSEQKGSSPAFVFLSQPYFIYHNDLHFYPFSWRYYDFTFIWSWWSSISYISHILVISRYADACLGWFHCITIGNDAGIDWDVQESLWCSDLESVIPQNGTTGSYGGSISRFVKNPQTDFRSGSFQFTSHQQWIRTPFSPYSGMGVAFAFWWKLLLLGMK